VQSKPSTSYDRKFYDMHQGFASNSAKSILEMVWKYYKPKSVVDVGCGLGDWLKVASELGVVDYLGLEGDWLVPDQVVIPWDHIQKCDLKNPFTIGRTFDLAMSLEVAEHLPGASAQTFIESLTQLAPVVLFSAAIPKQKGTNHLNEQWPAYWAKLFHQNGFATLDVIRCQMWNRSEVRWWYAQNTILYVNRAFLEKNERLQDLSKLVIPHHAVEPMSLVHPDLFHAPLSLRELLYLMPRAFKKAVGRRMKVH
jgi:hypothetical protein